jgi:tetratricopeptide (TPR) repeat protein
MRKARIERAADAERQENVGRWLEAAEIWSELAEEDGDAGTMVRHAQALKHAGKTADAENVLGLALKIAPGVSNVHFALGLLLEEQGRLADARQALEQGLCIEENSVFVTILGDVQRRLGDLAAAERTLRRSLNLDDKDDEAHYTLGLVLKDSKPLEAVQHIQEAISIDPALDRAYRELGQALWRAGRLSEAVDAFREAIARDHDNAWAHDYLGNLLQLQGDALAAKDEFAAATKAQPRIRFFW